MPVVVKVALPQPLRIWGAVAASNEAGADGDTRLTTLGSASA